MASDAVRFVRRQRRRCHADNPLAGELAATVMVEPRLSNQWIVRPGISKRRAVFGKLGLVAGFLVSHPGDHFSPASWRAIPYRRTAAPGLAICFSSLSVFFFEARAVDRDVEL